MWPTDDMDGHTVTHLSKAGFIEGASEGQFFDTGTALRGIIILVSRPNQPSLCLDQALCISRAVSWSPNLHHIMLP